MPKKHPNEVTIKLTASNYRRLLHWDRLGLERSEYASKREDDALIDLGLIEQVSRAPTHKQMQAYYKSISKYANDLLKLVSKQSSIDSIYGLWLKIPSPPYTQDHYYRISQAGKQFLNTKTFVLRK